jgi:nucleoid-associated protein YgaU
MKRLFLILLCASFALAVFSPSLFAQDKMKYEEYLESLKHWQDREAKAQAEIQTQDQLIDDLQERYRLTEEEIAKIQQEIYEMLGVFEADVENFVMELNKLNNQIQALRSLTPELLYQRQDELTALEDRINGLKSQPLAYIPDYQKQLSDYSMKVDGLRARVPKPRNDTYMVQRGDNLWKIASKPDIYNDPFKWPRIWSANAETIKDPNVIYPNQVLNIIRDIARNQHLVIRGETLSKIAALAEVYGDPFAWTKIFEANKNQIEDPNLIYPEQIFVLPGK